MVDEKEVEAVADALGERVAAHLENEYGGLHELLEEQGKTHTEFLTNIARVLSGNSGEQAWNDNVRAFAVVMLSKVDQAYLDAHTSRVVEAAVKMANEIEAVRVARREKRERGT